MNTTIDTMMQLLTDIKTALQDIQELQRRVGLVEKGVRNLDGYILTINSGKTALVNDAIRCDDDTRDAIVQLIESTCKEYIVQDDVDSSISAAIAEHEEDHHEEVAEESPVKQASDANILVNQTQLENMVYHELQCGLEGSGKICDIVQQFISDNLQIILPDHVHEQLNKWLPDSLALRHSVNDIVKDHIEDHRTMDHDQEASKKLVRMAVGEVAVAINVHLNNIRKEVK